MENLEEAASLSRYLIEEKKVKPKTAYIISARKYKVVDWHLVQKFYNQKLKTKQLELI